MFSGSVNLMRKLDSFYSEDLPPFVHAMGKSLTECGHRQRRLPGTEWLYGSANKQFDEDNAFLHSVADKVSHPEVSVTYRYRGVS